MDGGARRGGAAASGKRDQGIKKKAWELATLCGVDVCLLGVDPAGNLFFWPDDVNELRGITHRYLDAIRGGGGGESPGTKEKKRKRALAERKKMHGRGSLANEDVASSSQAGIGSLVPPPPPAVPLPSLVVWIHTSPTPATAVGLDDYGGDVGEDMLCLIRSPSWEDLPPFDMEPQPTTEDGGGGGGFPIPGGVLFPCNPPHKELRSQPTDP